MTAVAKSTFVKGNGGYEGAKYAPVKRGACTRHGTRVVSVCIDCHREQLRAAGLDCISPSNREPISA